MTNTTTTYQPWYFGALLMYTFRLLDFVVKDEKREPDDESSDEDTPRQKTFKDTMKFSIQVFGLDEKGKTYCAHIEDFHPFFFVKVPDTWKSRRVAKVGEWIKEHIQTQPGSTFYNSSILSCTLVKQKTLYGFDGGKYYNFAKIEFANTRVMNKAKRLWYREGKLVDGGIRIDDEPVQLYEANILPLLRFFHIQNISPSGWVQVDPTHCTSTRGNHEGIKTTTCDYEFTLSYSSIQPLPHKETVVPYTICSFDIEASSSHGDFPVPIKTYKKLATDILDYWDDHDPDHREFLESLDRDEQHSLLEIILLLAFREPLNVSYTHCSTVEEEEYEEMLTRVHKVYPKKHARPTRIPEFRKRIQRWLETPVKLLKETLDTETMNTMKQFLQEGPDDTAHGGDMPYTKFKKNYVKKNDTILDLLNNRTFDREDKMKELTFTLNVAFPPLEGDYVTYIGSTFWRYGEPEPYLNHCIALGECSAVDGAQIDCYDTEREVLLAWTALLQKENPDILIGYNIFGFDYQYMFYRAKENHCINEFLRLSRNRGEICGKKEYKTKEYGLNEKELVIASGTHQLRYIHMPGRIQIDLYNYFRRDYNLTSYKLDYVSGYFIGDKVQSVEHLDLRDLEDLDGNGKKGKTKIYSKNLTGLNVGNFVNFEEIAHSSDMYQDGKKFHVSQVGNGWFVVDEIVSPNMACIVKWGLAKDDVTPQDIFAMANGTLEERATIAKYCIQDCNLVHHLLRKIDVVTGMVEMAKICSVPLEFLIMRGQGIKLFSFVAKQCRERNTLIPVVEKVNDGSYEGAIVLVPKSGLYLDEPVACVDYSSLYPSSMISENISHDSKVWTREYDLEGNLLKETGELNDKGEFVYDNMAGYEYVDIEYDTYDYIPNARGKEEKTLTGKKVCRFAQFPEGNAIMPEILSDLLKARKNTRKSAKWKTVYLTHPLCVNGQERNEFTGMLLTKTGDRLTITDKFGSSVDIPMSQVDRIQDTFDDFMKNVLDKRQLAIKVTANSLYGQCGARTSSFYEKDIAASTTATGRKLLTYGKRIIEEVYGDAVCETSYGSVRTKAEYIYGDTDSVFMSFKLHDMNGQPIRGKQALKMTIELAKEAGELATKFLKPPHDLEYEKTFMPFCLLSKKRYVGMLYEEDPDKCYRKSMGIVLKRRDNAPIVKDVYGGIIDILMKEQTIQSAVEFTRQCLRDMVNERYGLEKLVITKSLRGFYKNPTQIAHKVLADRMGKRDPGNKPSPGDRIPFVYVQTKSKVKLQGDKIEHPAYIRRHGLKPDYSHYITNQIMKPVLQVFALVMEQLPGYSKRIRMKYENELRTIEQSMEGEKFEKKRQAMREQIVKELVFDDALRVSENAKKGIRPITSFFGKS